MFTITVQNSKNCLGFDKDANLSFCYYGYSTFLRPRNRLASLRNFFSKNCWKSSFHQFFGNHNSTLLITRKNFREKKQYAVYKSDVAFQTVRFFVITKEILYKKCFKLFNISFRCIQPKLIIIAYKAFLEWSCSNTTTS